MKEFKEIIVMKIKKILIILLIGMIIFIGFMEKNKISHEEPLTIGTEYSVQVDDKQLYTFMIDNISKVQTYSNQEIVIIDFTYTNDYIDDCFIINKNNFKVFDDFDRDIEYIDCSLIHHKPQLVNKGQSYSAQLAYSIHENTKELFLEFSTQYTDDKIIFQLPVYR